MSELGIFCTVARTELTDKVENVSDDTLHYLNYAIKQSYRLGLGKAAEIAEGGNFLHENAPDAKFGREVAKAIRREAAIYQNKTKPELTVKTKKPLLYSRQIPQKLHNNIVTKKAQFFGKLMYAVLVAGGSPKSFRYDVLRYKTFENILDALLPNNVSFSVEHNKD